MQIIVKPMGSESGPLITIEPGAVAIATPVDGEWNVLPNFVAAKYEATVGATLEAWCVRSRLDRGHGSRQLLRRDRVLDFRLRAPSPVVRKTNPMTAAPWTLPGNEMRLEPFLFQERTGLANGTIHVIRK